MTASLTSLWGTDTRSSQVFISNSQSRTSTLNQKCVELDIQEIEWTPEIVNSKCHELRWDGIESIETAAIWRRSKGRDTSEARAFLSCDRWWWLHVNSAIPMTTDSTASIQEERDLHETTIYGGTALRLDLTLEFDIQKCYPTLLSTQFLLLLFLRHL